MGKIRQINIKNRTYYFYNDQIDLKDFDARLLKIDKKDYNEIDIYYIGYVTIKKIGDYNNINSVNPLYLIINEMIGHFEEKNENKYLVSDEIYENKEVLNNYEEVCDGIDTARKTIFPRSWNIIESSKNHVNIIFPSTFWLKKRPYFLPRKS